MQLMRLVNFATFPIFALLMSVMTLSLVSSVPTEEECASCHVGPPRVLVIGFGPSGMFFCHAVETRRRELEDAGEWKAASMLPIVSAFERSSTHGGVWRRRNASSSGTTSDPTTNDMAMYEGMWINGAKETDEFFDYTYEEHFRCALPPYIQREAILEYMEARVTRQAPDFFQKYATFNTDVKSVTYDIRTGTFHAITENLLTGEEGSGTYDKVIWAAGVNSIPYIPTSLAHIFKGQHNTPFKGTVLHSSEVSNLKEGMQGKRVLLIGGESSAEDLALTSIKLGADKVYISYRREEASVDNPDAWPLGKVELLAGTVPQRLDRNNCIGFQDVDPITLQPRNDTNIGAKKVQVCDIDTVIFCTGYKEDLSMLHPSVNALSEEPGNGQIKIYGGPQYMMPKEWKMGRNSLTDCLMGQDVRPTDELTNLWRATPYLYRYSVSIDNPSVMFMVPNAVSLNQLLWADALAWQNLAFITGSAPIPTKDKMVQWLNDQTEHDMEIAAERYELDYNYKQLILDTTCGDDEEHMELMELELSTYHYRLLADVMVVGNYPVDIGTFQELNEKGKAFVTMDMNDRANVPSFPWPSLQTFRDLDGESLSKIRSVFTGTKAAPFKKAWMDIDDFDNVRNLCSVFPPSTS